MRYPVVCAHGCGPIAVTWTRRGATLEADRHRVVCPNQPRDAGPSAVSDTLSQMLMCRFRRHGCFYMARYQVGQDDMARQAITAHERRCERRFIR